MNECLQVYTLDLFRISYKNGFHLSYAKIRWSCTVLKFKLINLYTQQTFLNPTYKSI